MIEIRRYLTKEKLIWLLDDKGIFLGPASEQSDSREGLYDHTYPRKLVEASPEKYTPAQLRHKKIDLSELDSLFKKMMQASREMQYLSSWFASDNEPSEMWENYGSDGVAIVSTDILITSNTPQLIQSATNMRMVQYNSDDKRKEIHNPLFVKDDKYSYENEFRIVFKPQIFSMLTGYNTKKYGVSYIGNEKSFESKEIDSEQIDDALNFIREKDCGYLFLYPLDKIITEIRINPYCTAEQEKELRNLINSANLTIPVSKSEVNKHSGR